MRDFESLVRPSVRRIVPYIPGRPISDVARQYHLDPLGIVKLASNENPLGAPQIVLNWEVGLSPSQRRELLSRYPEDSGREVRHDLARKHGVNADSIVIGNGSVELIRTIALTLIHPGDEVLVSEHAFAYFEIESLAAGARVTRVPMRNFTHDLTAMRRRITKRTKIVWIANPNNPTGTMNTRDELDTFLDGLPDTVVVVVDEAYADIVDQLGYPSALRDIKDTPWLIVLRTMSKIGLADRRFGYAISKPDVVGAFWKRHLSFSVSSYAQESARCAILDWEHIERTRKHFQVERRFLRNEYEKLGLELIDSVTNFFLVHFPIEGQEIATRLEQKGIIVRPMAGYGFPMSCRISFGTRDQNERLIEALHSLKLART